MVEAAQKKSPQKNWRIYGEDLAGNIEGVKAADAVFNKVNESGVSKYMCYHIIKPFIDLRDDHGNDVFMRDIKSYIDADPERFKVFMSSRNVELEDS